MLLYEYFFDTLKIILMGFVRFIKIKYKRKKSKMLVGSTLKNFSKRKSDKKKIIIEIKIAVSVCIKRA